MKSKSVAVERLGLEPFNPYSYCLTLRLNETNETRLSPELKTGKNRVLRVMHLFGIKPPGRKSHFYTTRSTKEPHKYTNLIKDLTVTKSNQF